ncbi:MAG: NTP transferase domain-containing protein [Candidatus Eisenbacteria bacterium]
MNVGVLLAAGASTRMKSPKPLVKWKGHSFLVHGTRALWSSCDVVVAVLGSNGEAVRSSLEKEFTALVESGALTQDLHEARRKGSRGLELRFETNAKWKQGMLSSAKVGLAAALKAKPATIAVLPVDHPEVSGETVSAMTGVMLDALKAFKDGAAGFPYALVPRFKGHRGHPLVLSPALARAIVKDKVAADLGDAVRRHARMVGYVDVRDPGVVKNRNTPNG